MSKASILRNGQNIRALQAMKNDRCFSIPVRFTIHFEITGHIVFDLNKEIVAVIVGDLLFHSDDGDGISHARALGLFHGVNKEGEETLDSNEVAGYLATVKYRRKFNLLVKFIACGASFRQAARQMECVNVETGIGDYGGCSDTVAANYVRVVCAQSLQLLSQCISKVWAFSLAVDSSTHQGMSYLDVRVRFGHAGALHNFHLLAIPMFERHTGEYMFELLARFLDAMLPSWRTTVIAVSSDGAANMTGRIKGLVTRLQDECAPGILRIWCGLRQFDLVMQSVYSSAMNDKFYCTLTGLIGHLRRQQVLVGNMQSLCPKVANTRWISVGSVTKWLTKHHVRIRHHLTEKAPACAPDDSWWYVLFIIHAIATKASTVFTALQGRDTLLTQQHDSLRDLVHSFCSMSGMKGPLAQVDVDAAAEIEPTEVCGAFVLTVENASQCMAGTSVWVCETMATIARTDPNELERIARSTVRVFVRAADGISKIVAERDQNNQAIHFHT